MRRALSVLLCLGVSAFAASMPASASMTAAGSPRWLTADTTVPTLPASVTLPEAVVDVEEQISIRTTELATLSSLVAGSRTLTPGDRDALTAIITTASSGLSQLQMKLESDTTMVQVRADEATVVLGYHVFAFVSPQVQDVVTTDGDLAEVASLTGRLPAIETAIAVLSGARQVRAAARQRRLSADLGAAQNALAGLSSTLLALTAAGYPQNAPILATAAAADKSASSDLSAANSQLTAIVNLLAAR